jgi:hypothetical protein
MHAPADMRKRQHVILAVCSAFLAVVTCLGSGAEPASASRSPRTTQPWVSFTLGSSAEVHVATAVRICAHRVPHGYASYLEHAVEAGHSWKIVAGFKLAGSACTTYRLRASSPGPETFRLQLWYGGKVQYQTPVRTVTVFGHVTFVRFCKEGLIPQGFLPHYCQAKTLLIGGTPFVYLIADAEGAIPPHYDVLIELLGTTCNSVVVHMGVVSAASSASTATIRIVQSGSSRHEEKLRAGHVRTFTFGLNRAAWKLDDWTSAAKTIAYYDGYANCSDLSGIG